jgi:hypothetical protein
MDYPPILVSVFIRPLQLPGFGCLVFDADYAGYLAL